MRRRKYKPDLPRGNSIDVKPNMIESDRNIVHKSVMSICELFMDRDEPAHLVYQRIHDIKVIVNTSAEGYNDTYQLFAESVSVD